MGCSDNNGHLSDWCECRGTTPNPTCPPDPGNPAVYQEQHYSVATFFNRSTCTADTASTAPSPW